MTEPFKNGLILRGEAKSNMKARVDNVVAGLLELYRQHNAQVQTWARRIYAAEQARLDEYHALEREWYAAMDKWKDEHQAWKDRCRARPRFMRWWNGDQSGMEPEPVRPVQPKRPARAVNSRNEHEYQSVRVLDDAGNTIGWVTAKSKEMPFRYLDGEHLYNMARTLKTAKDLLVEDGDVILDAEIINALQRAEYTERKYRESQTARQAA